MKFYERNRGSSLSPALSASLLATSAFAGMIAVYVVAATLLSSRGLRINWHGDQRARHSAPM